MLQPQDGCVPTNRSMGAFSADLGKCVPNMMLPQPFWSSMWQEWDLQAYESLISHWHTNRPVSKIFQTGCSSPSWSTGHNATASRKSSPAFPRYKNAKQQTAQTVKFVQIATAEARVRKLIPPATDYTYQAPVVISLDAAGKPSITRFDHDTLRNGQSLPPNLVKLGLAYQKASRDISTRLVDFLKSQLDSKPECSRAQIRALYTIEDHTENVVSSKYPRMRSGGAFKSIASKARQSGWVMNDEVAGWFITAIKNRRELRNWYDRFPSNDSRREDNEQHEAWLQMIIEVVVALAGHQA